jgi:hypothetical protein
VSADQIIALDARHGLLDAAERASVRRARCVDGLREDALDTPSWISLRLAQVVQPLIAKAFHFALGEARRQGHLGQQVERRCQARAGHLDARRQAVPVGVGAQVRAQALGGLDEGHGIAALGALRHGACGEHGDARSLCWLAGGATP